MAKLRCAIYTRKSSEEGLEQNFNSLHAQREACEAYVLSQAGEGWSALKAAYDDGGFSGGSMERPGLKHLLSDIQQGLVDVVVVYKVDRLTRSLADFAKIVEQFDAKGVSFVSVTQAFNTTTSMGRLTLNVLLSFAQFEREVTGERIRDKIAASRAKGLRTGARPPLGYDTRDGRLVVNEEEADRVRAVFRRYLELGTLNLLVAERILSKRWTSKARRVRGGVPMVRGALHYLLTNVVYRGTTRHKDKLYPDTHPAIVDDDLWAEVQARLTSTNASQPASPIVRQGTALRGKVQDDRGHPMLPVHTSKGALRYRYYVSRPCVNGAGEPGSLKRVAAGELEQLLAGQIEPRLHPAWDPEVAPHQRVFAAIETVTVSRDRLEVRLLPDALDDPQLDLENPVLRIPVRLSRSQSVRLVQAEGVTPAVRPRPDRILVRAVALARAWSEELETGAVGSIGALASREGLCEHYTARLLPLAYLAPDLVQLIVDGRQPRTMTLKRLTADPLPADWAEQRRHFAAIG